MLFAAVRKARIDVHSNDAAAGVRALRGAESGLPRALTALAEKFRDEVLLVRNMRLDLDVTGRGALWVDHWLGRELHTKLDSLLAEHRDSLSAAGMLWFSSRNGGSPASRDDEKDVEVVWFSSEPRAVAAYLLALLDRRAGAWPFSAMHPYGADWGGAWQRCLERGPDFLADTVALVARERPSALGAVEAERAAGLVAALADGLDSAARRMFDPALLPSDVRERLEGAMSEAPRTLSDPQRHLLLLGSLFAEWPPARGHLVRPDELERMLRGAEKRQVRPSSAGGLVFWAGQFGEIESSVEQAYPRARVAAAVRWAIGRTLEQASLSPQDPLLLVWAGESPDAILAAAASLDDADPERLHEAALRLALARGWLEPELRVFPFGDEWIALGTKGIVVDSVGAKDADAAMALLVRNLRRRAPGVAPVLEILSSAPPESIDSIAEVDAPFAPEPFRAPLRAFCSVLRRALEHDFGAPLSSLHGWSARVVGDDRIVLRRRDFESVAPERDWRDGPVAIAGKRYELRFE